MSSFLPTVPSGDPSAEPGSKRHRPRKRTRGAVAAPLSAAVLAVPALAVLAAFGIPPVAAANAGEARAADGAGPVPPIAVKAARDLGISPVEALDRLRAQPGKNALADRLTSALGARSAGAYVDSVTGSLVVNVTDPQAGQRVRKAGARTHVVSRSMDRLKHIQTALERVAVPGSTVAVDVRENTVDATIPEDRSGQRARELIERARSFGDAVDVTRTPGSPRVHGLDGGEALRGADFDCAAAFAAERGGADYVLTAGHCTHATSSWSFRGSYVGSSAGSAFPGDDYGLIRVNGTGALSGRTLHKGQPYKITDADNPPVGSYVCATGPTSGTACGTITAYDLTINYPKGTVRGLIGTDVCTHPGDSGAPLYVAENTAVGILSGGRTVGCSHPAFRSYFENVTEALDEYNLTLK